MKMVIDGYAGAGCITMGGYDYHGGMRQEGETKDFRAGRCMGAVLEYAARMEKPVMLYVFSDGSLSSNGVIDNSVAGRGKGEWTSDNQDTAAPFFLVYNPPTRGGRAQLLTSPGLTAAQHQQLGYFSADGNVVRSGTPGANNVNLLVAHGALELHGAARRARPVRDAVPEPRPRRPSASRPVHRVRSDRLAEQTDRHSNRSLLGSSERSLQRLLGQGRPGNRCSFCPAGFHIT